VPPSQEKQCPGCSSCKHQMIWVPHASWRNCQPQMGTTSINAT
jgi:hypothetical protein